jgi:hypothetical protein
MWLVALGDAKHGGNATELIESVLRKHNIGIAVDDDAAGTVAGDYRSHAVCY